ncbi:titin [Diachasmimorpha longicaudata]|uniref:titin n=1 Tax=Diachasmimorpha longicaudata TaxID=58733 RepID=UPI0030B8E209
MDRRDKWKSKPRNFESEEARLLRVDQHQARRQTKKEAQLNRLRQVSSAQHDEEEFEDTSEDRAIRLKKWKAERDLKKKLDAKNKRPAFVIGVPHHNFFSPVSKDPPKPHCHKKMKGLSPPKRVTTVTARRLAAKQATRAPPTGSSSASQPSTSTGASRVRPPKTPVTPRLTRSRKKALEASNKGEQNVKLTKKVSLAPENYEFKGPKFAEPIPLFGAVIVPDVDTDLTFNLTNSFQTTRSKIPLLETLREIDKEIPPKSAQFFEESAKKISPEKTTARIIFPEKKTDKKIFPEKEIFKIISPKQKPSRISSSEREILKNISPGESTLKNILPEEKTPKNNSPKRTSRKESTERKSLRKISSKKETPEKTTPRQTLLKVPEPIMKQESSQPCDSSIESVILRMSSQFEPLECAEDIMEKKENVHMNVDPVPSILTESVPVQFSPYIVTSRGKSNARKEQKQRLSLYKTSPKDDIPTKETVMQSLNISVEEEKNTSQYYKFLVESEEARLTDLCSTWKSIQEDSSTPEDGVYMINQAIGQTNLLIRKKFERFKTLVNDCETGLGVQLVRCADLQGFWEMMQMEIINCNSRFTKLEEIKSKGWQEDDQVIVQKKTVPKKKPALKQKVEGRSNMRAFIEAQRKKKMAQELPVEVERPEVKELQVEEKPSTPRKSLPNPVSPHSRAKVTPREQRMSLLKLVQLTESAKKMTQKSLAMVKVSQKCKTPEVEHDRSISYINSGQIPGKGILKKTEDAPLSEGKPPKPTKCKVNFNDTVDMTEVPQEEMDEDEENRRSLAVSLAKIESLEFEYDDDIYASKKLEFEDEQEDDVEAQIQPTGSEPGAPEGAIEMDEATEMETGIPVSPVIAITPTSPPVQVMPPPTTVTSPKNKKTVDVAGTPIIEVTEATPVPQPPKNSESTASPVEVKIRKRRKSGRSGKKSLKNVIEIDSTPSSGSPRNSTKRRSLLQDFEVSTPSPVVVEKNLRRRRTTEAETGIPIIDIATPESSERRGKSVSALEMVLSSGSRGGESSERNVDSPFSETISASKTLKKGRKSEAALEVESTPVRQLRNRSIQLDNVTYRKRRTSKHEKTAELMSGEEVNHPNDDDNCIENCSGVGNVKLQSPKTPKMLINLDTSSVRRSARKGVRFVPEDDCTACRPVPLTPRSLKNRISFFGNADVTSQPLANGDLMAFESPRTPRARIRRSSTKGK